MANKNVEAVRRAYEAFERADLETIQKAFAPDVVLHVAGRSPIAGDYKGRDEVLGFLGQVVSLSDGTFKVEPHDIVGNDEHVAVLSRATAARGGKTLDVLNFEVYHVTGGLITEAWFFSGDPYVEDPFWA